VKVSIVTARSVTATVAVGGTRETNAASATRRRVEKMSRLKGMAMRRKSRS
jgi:hypothetical protein